MAIEHSDAEPDGLGAEDLDAEDVTAEDITEEDPEVERLVAEIAPEPAKASKGRVAELGRKAARSSAREARVVLNDLKAMRFKDEVLPIDESNIGGLVKEFVFWAVTLLGIVPLLIVSISGADAQFTLFALFFALVWGVIFKMFVLRDDSPWRFPIGALFFTGIVGIYVLLFIYRYLLPDFYLGMSDNESGLVSWLGFVFQVGVWEELTKAVPVLLYLRWKREQAEPMLIVVIGVFSGLGFAAFENLLYGDRAIMASVDLTLEYGEEGLEAGVQSAMIQAMLRSLSLVFCHAVWAGIVAYFIAVARLERGRWGAMIVVGIGVAAVLHGSYNWLTDVQMTMAAATAGFSFALFYGYVYKLRNKIETSEAAPALMVDDATADERG